ncbi:hypothetical protein [Mycobacterium tuberculosis]|uniref:hypothetical protein n=1 Tax=Mycobacterium tuberculosis TaxID=1773 RepID=UPI00272D488D|nr:hypothetical protein [Mycobacterium tuberculosis]
MPVARAGPGGWLQWPLGRPRRPWAAAGEGGADGGDGGTGGAGGARGAGGAGGAGRLAAVATRAPTAAMGSGGRGRGRRWWRIPTRHRWSPDATDPGVRYSTPCTVVHAKEV